MLLLQPGSLAQSVAEEHESADEGPHDRRQVNERAGIQRRCQQQDAQDDLKDPQNEARPGPAPAVFLSPEAADGVDDSGQDHDPGENRDNQGLAYEVASQAAAEDQGPGHDADHAGHHGEALRPQAKAAPAQAHDATGKPEHAHEVDQDRPGLVRLNNQGHAEKCSQQATKKRNPETYGTAPAAGGRCVTHVTLPVAERVMRWAGESIDHLPPDTRNSTELLRRGFKHSLKCFKP